MAVCTWTEAHFINRFAPATGALRAAATRGPLRGAVHHTTATRSRYAALDPLRMDIRKGKSLSLRGAQLTAAICPLHLNSFRSTVKIPFVKIRFELFFGSPAGRGPSAAIIAGYLLACPFRLQGGNRAHQRRANIVHRPERPLAVQRLAVQRRRAPTNGDRRHVRVFAGRRAASGTRGRPQW